MVDSAHTVLGAFVLAVLCGCGDGGDSGGPGTGVTAATLSGRPLEDTVPAGVKSFDVEARGSTVHLLYTAPGRSEHYSGIYFIRSIDGGETWSAPVAADEGSNPTHHPSYTNAPQVASHGDRMVAVWTTKGTGFMGRGPMASACSKDAGSTWDPGPRPWKTDDLGGQAFLDLAADDEGVFHLVWLGKRSDDQKLKSLMYAKSVDDGATWSEPLDVDDATCECCWNRLSLDSGGNLYTIYRDIDPRDMSAAKIERDGSEWNSLGRVGAFDWQFNGCPHVGGDLVAWPNDTSTSLHAMVWTGKDESEGVYYVRSLDDGANWEAPQRVGEMSKFPDIAGSAAGVLARVWDTADEGIVYVSLSCDDGSTWSDALALSNPDDRSDHPSVVAVGDEFRIFWSEDGGEDGARLKSKLVRANHAGDPRDV